MKICISTVYDSVNCGAFLQAYALKKVLENMGYEVYHLRYTSAKERKSYIFEKDKISYIKYIMRHFGYTGKNYRIYKDALKYFKEIDSEELKSCDLLIVGSDEVWNVTNASVLRYINKSNWGTGKQIAYAVSCGNAKYGEILANKKVMTQIENMEQIFVRDLNTKNNMYNILGKQCDIVCDPTLLLDFKLYESEKYKKIDKPYIMYYGYWTREKSFSILKKYSREQKLELNAIGLNNPQCDNSINCHPLNFIKYIEDATLFVTSTFHGTIFGILNHKDLIVVDSDSEKVKDLLKKLGLENRLINEESSYEDFIKLVGEKIDYREIDKKIEKMKLASTKLLQECLFKIEKEK